MTSRIGSIAGKNINNNTYWFKIAASVIYDFSLSLLQ